MNPKHIDKLCQACLDHILDGNAKQDQWLQSKKDILHKWYNGFALSPKQVEMLTNMYNYEIVMNRPQVDPFNNNNQSKPTKPNKASKKTLPRKPPPIDAEPIPF
jgi:hypothetical protein